MVQRIFSQPGVRSSNPFDPLAISRTAQQASSSASGAFSALDTLQSKQKAFDDQQSSMNAEIAYQTASRVGTERQIEYGIGDDPSGVNLAQNHIEIQNKAFDEQRAKITDPSALKLFDERRQRTEQGRLFDAFKNERNANDEFHIHEFNNNIDNAQQRISQAGLIAPKPQRHFERIGSEYKPANAKKFLTSDKDDSHLNFKPEFGGAVTSLLSEAKEAGHDVKIFSGFRSIEHQKKLWDNAVAKYGSAEKARKWVAPPGRSSHNNRGAADLAGPNGSRLDRPGNEAARKWIHENAARHGLSFRMSHEPWHVELSPGSMPKPDTYRNSVIPRHKGETVNILKQDDVAAELEEANSVIDASNWSAFDKHKAKQNVRSRLAIAGFQRLAEQDPSAAFDVLQSGNLNDELTFEQSGRLGRQIISDLESKVKAQAKVREKEFKDESEQMARDIIAYNTSENNFDIVNAPQELSADRIASLNPGTQRNLEASVIIGQAARAAESTPIEQLADARGDFLPSGQGFANEQKALEAFDKVANKRLEEHAINSTIDFANENGLQPPIDNKGVREELDRRFAEAASGENPTEAIQSFVEKNKVIPKSFGNIVASALNGDNIEAKKGVIETVGQLHRTHPVKLSDNKSPAIDKALAVETYLQKGVQFDEALKLANELEAPVNPTLAGGRKQVWNQKVNKESMSDQAWEKMSENLNEVSDDGIFFDSPAGLPETAWAEYADLARDKFIQTGDFDVAVNVAQRAFLARHAITGVGGARRWQKDAPERRYSVYGDERDTAWIQADAIEHARKEFPNAKGITLRPVAGSYRDDQPEYQVFTTSDGVVTVASEPFIPNVESERAILANEVSENTQSTLARAKSLNAQAKVEAAVTQLQRLRMRVGRSPISREANKGLLDEAEKRVRDLEAKAAPLLEKEAKRKAEFWDRIKDKTSEAFDLLGQGVIQGGVNTQ